MSPKDWAILPVKKYAEFTGRSRRSEYWWFVVLLLVAYVVAGILDSVMTFGLASTVVALGLLIPNIAVSMRRLHDTNRTGWWLLIGFIPVVGAIVLIIFFAQKGVVGDNQYGSDPIGDPEPTPVVA